MFSILYRTVQHWFYNFIRRHHWYSHLEWFSIVHINNSKLKGNKKKQHTECSELIHKICISSMISQLTPNMHINTIYQMSTKNFSLFFSRSIFQRFSFYFSIAATINNTFAKMSMIYSVALSCAQKKRRNSCKNKLCIGFLFFVRFSFDFTERLYSCQVGYMGYMGIRVRVQCYTIYPSGTQLESNENMVL